MHISQWQGGGEGSKVDGVRFKSLLCKYNFWTTCHFNCISHAELHIEWEMWLLRQIFWRLSISLVCCQEYMMCDWWEKCNDYDCAMPTKYTGASLVKYRHCVRKTVGWKSTSWEKSNGLSDESNCLSFLSHWTRLVIGWGQTPATVLRILA